LTLLIIIAGENLSGSGSEVVVASQPEPITVAGMFAHQTAFAFLLFHPSLLF